MDYTTMNQTELIWEMERQTGEARHITAQPGDTGMAEVLNEIAAIIRQYPASVPANPDGTPQVIRPV